MVVLEGLSDQWWDLVHSSPWFRHYWLHECFSDPQTDLNFDIDFIKQEENNKELITLGLLQWNKSRFTAEIPRYGKKVPKIVNVRVTPRHIQQPR